MTALRDCRRCCNLCSAGRVAVDTCIRVTRSVSETECNCLGRFRKVERKCDLLRGASERENHMNDMMSVSS